MEEESLEALRKLAPFAVRAHVAETGRQRLLQLRNKLAFVLVTTDISKNSLDEVLKEFPCPVYQALTMETIAEFFRFQGTKIVGFRRNVLSSQIQRCFQGCHVALEYLEQTAMPSPLRVVLFGAGNAGLAHAAQWRDAGAEVVGFLAEDEESLQAATGVLSTILGYAPVGGLSPEELLKETSPHVVDVCLPTRLHFAGCHLGLRLGCHVLCETPFVLPGDAETRRSFLKRGEELVSLAARHRRLFGVMDGERTIPEFAQGKAIRTALQAWKEFTLDF